MFFPLLRQFLSDVGGNIAVTFSLALPVLLGATGLAVDSAAFYNQQSRMQGVADSTALAVAKELHLFVDDTATLEAAGETRAEVLLAEADLAGREHTVDVTLDTVEGHADVRISMAASAFLPAEIWGENPIVVTARANTYGQVRLCVLGLDDEAGGTVLVDQAALITAPDCAVQSNSTDEVGLIAKASSRIVSSFICTSGGYEGTELSFVPPPQTDCPVLADPLESRIPPPVGGCDFLDFVVDSGEENISPGHYCGGLTVKNNATVNAEPGVYVISGGKLTVTNDATFRGEEVGFYFSDDAALIDFTNNALIELGAPKSGPMAGILFYENPGAQEGRGFTITSQSARKLLGTIYLPRGMLKVGGRGRVAEASAYTIIVARRIEMDGGTLVINADYASSGVPVPLGVGNNSQVRLDR